MHASELAVPEQCLPFTEMHRTGGANYADAIAHDVATLAPHLPDSVDSIIDLGCGMGGFSVYLRRRYPQARLMLLDGDGTVPEYGWSAKCQPYNSRALTEALLAANGVAHDGWLDVGTKDVLRADLIVSLLSWGFHYPRSAYRVEGCCVADLRKTHNPPLGRVLWEGSSLWRCMWWQDENGVRQ